MRKIFTSVIAIVLSIAMIFSLVGCSGSNKEIKKFLDTLREPGIDEVVGETTEVLAKQPQDGRLDSPLNDWIADLMKEYAGVKISIHNNGGTRVDMPKGTITKRDLVEVHPFDNMVSVVTVNGKFLKKFIKTGFAPRSLFTYAGLQITYKVDKKGRIKKIKILLDGKPRKNRTKYVIVTNERAFDILFECL